MKIGLAGTGRMGAAMARRLLTVGHDVMVWNRTPGKTTPLAAAGAKVAATPADLAASADLVLTILTNADAIEATYHGASGLLSGDVKGKLFVEMSTVRPEVEQALAKKIEAKGAALVECPVGGTVGPAQSGKLLGFAGGAAADVARARGRCSESSAAASSMWAPWGRAHGSSSRSICRCSCTGRRWGKYSRSASRSTSSRRG